MRFDAFNGRGIEIFVAQAVGVDREPLGKRADRLGLRPCEARNRGQRNGTRGQMQELSAEKPHDRTPRSVALTFPSPPWPLAGKPGTDLAMHQEGRNRRIWQALEVRRCLVKARKTGRRGPAIARPVRTRLQKRCENRNFDGGRTRDRTLDLSRVKGTLSR